MAENKDLFAPPTKDELDLFAPPTEDELNEPSIGQDFLRGAGEGASMGFYDEAKGALASPKGAAKATAQLLGFSPDVNDEDLQKYLEARNKSREDLQQAKERSPIVTTAGEIAGGFAVPGFGSAKAGLSTAKGLTQAALLGAGTGALGSIGTSEAETPEELKQDVKSGAALGAATGGVFHGLEKGAKLLGKTAKESEFGQLVKKAFQEGEEGRGFTGIPQVESRLKEEQSTVKNLANQLESTEDKFGKNIQQKLLDATTEGKAIKPDSDGINLANTFSAQLDERPSLLSKKSSEIFSRFKNGEAINPDEANTLRRELRDLAGSLDPKDLDQREIIQNAQNFSKSLNDKLDVAVPDFKQANQQFAQFRQAGSESALSKGLDSEISGKNISGLKNSTADLNNSLNHLVQKLSSSGTSSENAQKTYMEIEKKLKLFDQLNPGALKQQGFSVDNFLKTLKDQADLTAIRRGIRGYEPQSSSFNQFINYFSPRGGGLLTANVAGKIAGGAKKAIGKLTPSFYKANPEQLQQVSSTLMNNDKLKYLGKALDSAVTTKNIAAKNAALFTISQNPEARELVKEFFPQDESTNEESP